MKKLLAMVLTAALTLTSAGVVFAQEIAVEPIAEVEVEAVLIENVRLNVLTRNYTHGGGAMLGAYPYFPGNAALNQRVERLLNQTQINFWHAHQVSVAQGTHNNFFRFEVEETLTAARVELFVLNQNLGFNSLLVIYINKATNAEITAADFADSPVEGDTVPVEAVEVEDEEKDEEAEVAVIEMSPLRVIAEAAGFTVLWDNGAVTISNDDVVLEILTGSLVATLTEGEEEAVEITLEAAPVNIDGTLYVPVSLLVDVLGIDLEALEAPVVVEEEEEEAEEEDEEAEEDEEEDEEDEEDEE